MDLSACSLDPRSTLVLSLVFERVGCGTSTRKHVTGLEPLCGHKFSECARQSGKLLPCSRICTLCECNHAAGFTGYQQKRSIVLNPRMTVTNYAKTWPASCRHAHGRDLQEPEGHGHQGMLTHPRCHFAGIGSRRAAVHDKVFAGLPNGTPGRNA
eukprot:4702784-Amphidinium_carterae.1